MLQRLTRVTSAALAATAIASLVALVVVSWVRLGWPEGKLDLGASHRFFTAGAVAAAGLVLIWGVRRAAPRHQWAAALLAAVAAALAIRWTFRGIAVFLEAQSALWP